MLLVRQQKRIIYKQMHPKFHYQTFLLSPDFSYFTFFYLHSKPTILFKNCFVFFFYFLEEEISLKPKILNNLLD